jgi:plastocyanin
VHIPSELRRCAYAELDGALRACRSTTLPLWSQGGPGNRDRGAVARRTQFEVAVQEVGVHGPHTYRVHPVRSGGARCRLRRLRGYGGGSPTTTAAPTISGAGTPGSGTAVAIDNFAFSPATLKVTVGQQVTWTNKQQGVAHTVTDDGGAFDHPMPSGATFSFTFAKAGTFAYHCRIHPSMHGTIVAS